MERWPNFFIVGAPRAGTTSLYDLLKRTQSIFMPQYKEPHFFSKIDSTVMYPPPIRDKKNYLELFKNAKNEIAIGEASTSYLWDPTSPKLIHDVIPNAKIIIILRNPIERAYSHFLLRLSHGKHYSFKEAIQESLKSDSNYYQGEIINGGFYFKEIKRYLEMFGSSNVKILIFEEFFKEVENKIKDVLQFLNVNTDPPVNRQLVHNYLTQPRGRFAASILQNKILRKIGKNYVSESMTDMIVRRVLGKKITKPLMLEEDRNFLKNIYTDDIKDLKKLLARDLPWSI